MVPNGSENIHLYTITEREDKLKEYENLIECVLSHETLHIALLKADGKNACSALDNLEKWGNFQYSHPIANV